LWVDEMIEADEVNAKGALTWTREGEATKVKWVDEGTLPPVIGGYFVGFINNMLAENFQTGLKNLKAVAEKRQAAGQAAPVEAAPPVATPAAP
jgi:hypothetical protein